VCSSDLVSSIATYVGVLIQYRNDGSIFNLRRLQARIKVFSSVIQDLLFVDDCTL